MVDALLQEEVLLETQSDGDNLEKIRISIMKLYNDRSYEPERDFEDTFSTDIPSLYNGEILQENPFNEDNPFGLKEAPLG